MKNIHNLIICSAVISTIVSCSFLEDESSSKNVEDVKTIVELPDSVKKKIVEQDALMTELLNKVDTLTIELNAIKTENAKLKEIITEFKSPQSTWVYVSIGAFIFGLIAFVLEIFRPTGTKKEDVYAIFKKCLDESRRINELQENVRTILSQRNRNTSQQSNYTSPNTEIRLIKLENALNQIVLRLDGFSQQSRQSDSPSNNTKLNYSRESDCQRSGYANINSGNIFTKILDSAQEGCVFKIDFKNENEGEFSIISLDKIKSRNGWQEIVEYTGAIEDATGFKVEEYGRCEKYDDVTWQVTKKLKIKLQK